MKYTHKIMLTILSLLMAACSSANDRTPPVSGDAVPAPEFQLADWCKSTAKVSAEARKTLDAMFRALAAADCFEFEYRYSRLERRKLSLAFENLTDPAPILSLLDLQELSIRGNKFSGLNWTRNFEHLVMLDASENPLSILSGDMYLKNLAPGLTVLVLDGTGVTGVFGENSVLTSLSLAGNKVSDLQFIRTLPGLSSFAAGFNNIVEIEDLSALTSLKTLNLSANPIAKLNALAAISSLSELSLAEYPAALTLSRDWLPPEVEILRLSLGTEPVLDIDVSRISDFSKLRILVADGRSFGGDVAFFPRLTGLSLERGRLPDPGVLRNLPGLQSLNISAIGLAYLPDLSMMAGLGLLTADRNGFAGIDGRMLPSNIKSLSLEYSEVRKLSHMNQLDKMSALSLKGNGIGSVDEFSWPPLLSSLDLAANRITRLESLDALSNLKMLFLARNRITNSAPLAELTSLEWLDLSGNQLDTIAPLSALTHLNMLDIRSNGLPAAVLCPLVITTACLF